MALVVQPVFPFVVGCPRSGTTLLRAILNAHPDVAVPPESDVVRAVLRRARKHVADGTIMLEAVLDDVLTTSSIHEWQLPQDAFDDIRRAQPSSLEDVLRLIYSGFASRRGKSRYADKTPRNLLIMDEIADALPEARFVHLVRDARNVAPSWAAANFGPDNVLDAAKDWNSWVHLARASGTRVGPTRYREVRYEDLTNDPEPVVRDLCAFLDLTFTLDMLEYYTNADDVLTQVRNPHLHEHIREPPRANIRNWETALSGRQIAEIEYIAGAGLREYGYRLSGRRIGVDVVARVRARAFGKRARTVADEAGRRMLYPVKAVRHRVAARRASS
jgi:hypothetical protein